MVTRVLKYLWYGRKNPPTTMSDKALLLWRDHREDLLQAIENNKRGIKHNPLEKHGLILKRFEEK